MTGFRAFRAGGGGRGPSPPSSIFRGSFTLALRTRKRTSAAAPVRERGGTRGLHRSAPRGNPAGADSALRRAVPGLLVVLTVVAFSPVLVCGFVNYDDPVYVLDNPYVRGGLTPQGVRWAFTTLYFGNWHPLVWLSLQLESQLFGVRSGIFHATNLLLHAGSVMLLLASLRRMTGDFWPSAFAAALFAVHPLNVEPVAWVSERKGVLSTLFWMLTVVLYARYTKRPTPSRYAMVVAGMAGGLLAKPMLVTMPFVLLLLDYWPLRRWASGGDRPPAPLRVGLRLVAEKLPLLALALIASVVAARAQRRLGAVASFAVLPLPERLANATASYVWYLWEAIFPNRLAAFYPHPGAGIPASQVVGAAFLMAGITVASLWQRRQRPHLLVGWLWFVGTLVPVIGLVQVGSHSRADRYAYLPCVGLWIALCWLAAEFAVRWRCERALAGLAGLVLAWLALATWTQAHTWRDSVVLWQHALQVTPDNPFARNNLGQALLAKGDVDGGMTQLERALLLQPDGVRAHCNMGVALLQKGEPGAAAEHFRAALRVDSSFAVARRGLDRALTQLGATAEPLRPQSP